MVTGSAAIFTASVIHCELRSLKLIRRWVGLLRLFLVPSYFRKKAMEVAKREPVKNKISLNASENNHPYFCSPSDHQSLSANGFLLVA